MQKFYSKQAPSCWMRRAAFAVAVAGLFVSLPTACTFDPDDRCGENQVIYGDNVRCVCAEGSALTAEGCVRCAEGEVAGENGCVCAAGESRPAPGAPCEATPAGLGVSCDTQEMPCSDATYDHCETGEGTQGYCTNVDCSDPGDCQGGFACDTESSPSVCRRPPLGLGKACESDADCAGGEATYCDAFVSRTCLVSDCSLTADDCFVGYACCDLSAFGVPQPLCVPEGTCTT